MTRFWCYKNVGYTALIHFVSFAMSVSMKDRTLFVKHIYKNNDCALVAL